MIRQVKSTASAVFGATAKFDILAPDQQTLVGQISKQWGGLVKELFTTADTFGVSLPADMDVIWKAVLLGLTFFIDFQFYERSRWTPSIFYAFVYKYNTACYDDRLLIFGYLASKNLNSNLRVYIRVCQRRRIIVYLFLQGKFFSKLMHARKSTVITCKASNTELFYNAVCYIFWDFLWIKWFDYLSWFHGKIIDILFIGFSSERG